MFIFELEYSQIQGELLNQYRVELYDSGKHLRWNSGVRNAASSLNVEVGGLLNNTLYYIKAVGQTVNGFNLDTGLIPFSVEYKSSSLYSVLKLQNREHEAAVEISTNVVMIYGRPIPDPPVYIDGEIIDLRPKGHSVVFDEGFLIDDDFMLELTGFRQNGVIVKLTDGFDEVNIYWRKDYFLDGDNSRVLNTFAELQTKVSPHYVIFSNRIEEDVSDTDMIYLRLLRVDGLYDLRIEKV